MKDLIICSIIVVSVYFGALSLVASSAFVEAQTNTDTVALPVIHVNDAIGGVYTVVGVNPQSTKPYTAVVEISEAGGAWLLRWTLGKIPQGPWITNTGYGILVDGRLSVVIVDDNGENPVVAQYVLHDGVLSGHWSPIPTGIMSTEVMTPSDKDPEVLKSALPTPETRAL